MIGNSKKQKGDPAPPAYGKKNMKRNITEQRLKQFKEILIRAEKRNQTIEKYMRDIRKLQAYAGEKELTKELLIQYKEYLEQNHIYKVASINSFLAAANHFCAVMGWCDLRVKMIKVQKEAFTPENQELTTEEYTRLINTAMEKGRERLALIIQTLGSTGIRISELQYITVESLKSGMADIYNKGKVRRILYPSDLNKILRAYVKKRQIKSGCIFCTRNGKPIDRSNIWRDMKHLARQARVRESKVFPHNLRHLFARSYFSIEKNLAHLADILGHSSLETTQIYVAVSEQEHERTLNRMRLCI